MKLRSLLYMPAHAERFTARAHERDADAIILDLEDAVAEPDKDRARECLSDVVPHLRHRDARVYVRINAGPRLTKDTAAALAAGADGIVFPKANGPRAVAQLVAEMDKAGEAGQKAHIIAIIEDAAGLLDARSVAAHPRVSALCLGAEDFATDTGATPQADVVRLPKLLVHYAAKAEGCLSLGLLRSVAEFDDEKEVTAAAEEAARFGFDGATCIHPKVVSILNAAFTPTDTQIAHARRVITAADGSGRGAFMLDNEFIDLPVLKRAIATLARVGLKPDIDSD